MKDRYLFSPIEKKRNIRIWGPRKGKRYWRFGLGSRWEVKRDGSRRYVGWSFFIGRSRLVFGSRNLIVDLGNY